MRLALLTACVWLWAGLALAQTPCDPSPPTCGSSASSPCPADAGTAYKFLACYDSNGALAFRFTDNDVPVGAQLSPADLVGGVMTFPLWVPSEGAHKLAVTAIYANGESTATLFALAQVPPPPPPGCPNYRTPAGVLVPHAAGDVISGWNNLNVSVTATLADKQKYTSRIVQLALWGFTTITVKGERVVNPGAFPQVLLEAICQPNAGL